MEEKIQVIVAAIDVAISKGCYNLNDTASIIDALREVFPAKESDSEPID